MYDALERIWLEAVVTSSGYYNGNCLEGLREIVKILVMIVYVWDHMSSEYKS
jgi:hypothetical protein